MSNSETFTVSDVVLPEEIVDAADSEEETTALLQQYVREHCGSGVDVRILEREANLYDIEVTVARYTEETHQKLARIGIAIDPYDTVEEPEIQNEKSIGVSFGYIKLPGRIKTPRLSGNATPKISTIDLTKEDIARLLQKFLQQTFGLKDPEKAKMITVTVEEKDRYTCKNLSIASIPVPAKYARDVVEALRTLGIETGPMAIAGITGLSDSNNDDPDSTVM